MSRPTVRDIAKVAGVSLATVDRVLNARPGVRAATTERVHAAVASLGYRRDVMAANLARQRRYRFRFVLPDADSEFLADLRRRIAEAAEPLADRTEVEIVQLPSDDLPALLAALGPEGTGQIDGLAVMAEETPVVRDAIANLRQRGVPVVSLVTDQGTADSSHFIGINNVAAGRTAAVLVGRFVGPRPGAVAVVVNSTMARDMVERRLGFDTIMRERFPHLRVLPSLEGHDDRTQTEMVLKTCIAMHTDIVGVYSAGGGTRGITRALNDSRLASSQRITSVVHELTPHARAALKSGRIDAVITQDTGHIGRSALRVLRAKCDGLPIIEAQERIRIEIVLRENLP